jgi:aminoglycoside phosphotransferase (APT) family kinase protein
VRSSDDLGPEFVSWIEACAGASVTRVERLVGGSSREVWLVDVGRGGRTARELILRREKGGGPTAGTVFSLMREAAVYRALAGTGVRVPRVYGAAADLDVVLLERIEGDNNLEKAVDEETRELVAAGYMQELAHLHQIDPSSLPGLPFSVTDDAAGQVLLGLETWDQIRMARRAGADPLLAFCSRWLRSNVPEHAERAVVVHGDAGPGNFLFRSRTITALLDWELAHAGDPMEDLAWIATRSLFQPFGNLNQRFRDYEHAGGARVVPSRVDYFRVFVSFCCAINLSAALRRPDSAAEIATFLAFEVFHRRMICEGIARAIGDVAYPPEWEPEDDCTPQRDELLLEAVGRQLDDVIGPALGSNYPAHVARGAARVLAYLRNRSRFEVEATNVELAELEVLLGHVPRSPEAGRREIEELIAGDDEPSAVVFEHLARQVEREVLLARPAMGRLARVRLPVLCDPTPETITIETGETPS